MSIYNERTHTKLVSVPQERVWQQVDATGRRYGLTWEDGYDAVAYVEYKFGRWQWSTAEGCGYAKDFLAATVATGSPAAHTPSYYGEKIPLARRIRP